MSATAGFFLRGDERRELDGYYSFTTEGQVGETLPDTILTDQIFSPDQAKAGQPGVLHANELTDTVSIGVLATVGNKTPTGNFLRNYSPQIFQR
jgi:hypothetical protein